MKMRAPVPPCSHPRPAWHRFGPWPVPRAADPLSRLRGGFSLSSGLYRRLPRECVQDLTNAGECRRKTGGEVGGEAGREAGRVTGRVAGREPWSSAVSGHDSLMNETMNGTLLPHPPPQGGGEPNAAGEVGLSTTDTTEFGDVWGSRGKIAHDPSGHWDLPTSTIAWNRLRTRPTSPTIVRASGRAPAMASSAAPLPKNAVVCSPR